MTLDRPEELEPVMPYLKGQKTGDGYIPAWQAVGRAALRRIEELEFARISRKPIADLTPDEWGFMRCVAPRLTTQPL